MASSVEIVLLCLYVLLGPMAWGLIALVSAAGMQRMGQVRRARRRNVQPPAPLVSILIPAKDEGPRIADCLRSALGQDYPNLEVIAVDDRSDDETGAVMDELAAGEPRLKVIHVEKGNPPEGWTGKCNALRRAAQIAGGQWLLLVDSDVILSPDALTATLGVAIKRRYGLLSLFPRLECHAFLEKLAIPLAGAALMVLHLVALTNDDDHRTAFANGQFMLIRRDTYDAIGGHRAVRGQFCEDIEIARLVKARGLRPRICWGADLAAVRMYSSLRSIRRGWARIFYAAARGRPWRAIMGIAALILCGMSVYAAIAWGICRLFLADGWMGIIWLCVAGAHYLLMTILLALGYRSSGNPWRLALWFPAGAAVLIAIFAEASRLCFTGRLEWRGTCYDHGRQYMPVEDVEAPSDKSNVP